MKRSRLTLTSRMLLAGFIATVMIVAGIGGYLLRSGQDRANNLAATTASERAYLTSQLINGYVAKPSTVQASHLATQQALITALSGATPQTAVPTLLTDNQLGLPQDVNLVVIAHDANADAVVYTTECATTNVAYPRSSDDVATCEKRSLPHVAPNANSVHLAESEVPRTSPVPGVEFIDTAQTQLAYDVAVPILSGQRLVGVAVYTTLLATEFNRYQAVIGYPAVAVANNAAHSLMHFSTNQINVSFAPSSLVAVLNQAPAVSSKHPTIAATYSSSGSELAASYVPMPAPGGNSPAAWVGVEVAPSLYAGNTGLDLFNVLGFGAIATIAVFLLIFLFVDRFVRRPLGYVERSVSRIASGDYSKDVPVTSNDELGRLATGVNRMRAQIASYIGRLASSLDQLRAVSQALTTTTAGVTELRVAVVSAAQAIAGEQSVAALVIRTDDDFATLETEIASEHSGMDLFIAGAVDSRLRSLVPMKYQGQLVGVLMITTTDAINDTSAQALVALANNAAVALENTRMFDNERQMVAKLTELDTMKSDFLTTTQHELRTPVLAIIGELDLVKVGWAAFDDVAKFDMMDDIEVSARQMEALVETMVDFTLITNETLSLNRRKTELKPLMEQMLADLAKRYKGGLPSTLTSDIEPGCAVDADPARLQQVLRAVVDNAVKFTPAGGSISITARSQGDACHIGIIDTGVGIPVEALVHIFEPFYQADNSKTRSYGGMGMGLALVKHLCDLHGATVNVASKPGRGTTVHIRWPLPSATTPDDSKHAGFLLTANAGPAQETGGQSFKF